MDSAIEISKTQVMMAFVATCIEAHCTTSEHLLQGGIPADEACWADRTAYTSAL